MTNWLDICDIEDIVPGTGVCALAGERQVAIFRPDDSEALYAMDNLDPFFEASVLSRGIIGEHAGELYVASPLKKQRFRLTDGYCFDDPERSRQSFPVSVEAGRVRLAM